MLGLTVATLVDELAMQMGVPPGSKGVAILDVSTESSAWRKGVRAGDVIVELNEIPVHDVGALRKALQRSPKTAALRVVRGGAEMGFVFLGR